MSQPAARPDWAPLLADSLDETWRGDGFDPSVPPALWDHALRAPLDEFVRRPGKELRAVVCRLGWALGGGVGPMPEDVALVIDGLHTGSLIIDDLEDGAAERRGLPAFHLLHGDAAAINSGTWLYCWALERIAHLGGDPATQLHMHRRAIAVLRECHQGQALDLQARVDELDVGRTSAVCAAITRGKTAALAGLAVELAALTAGACPRNAAGAARLGHTIGTVLQMLDDVGSLGPHRRAKGHEDLRARRVTWPWAWLPEVADALTVARLRERVRHLDTVAALDGLADELHARIAPFARHRIRHEIDAGLALADHDHPDHPAVRTAAALLARMEESYG